MAIGTGAAILGGAVLGTAGSIIGGNKAADAAKGAAKSSNALQKYIYDTNRADQAPYRQIGTQALQQLGQLYGFTAAGAQQPATASGGWNRGTFDVVRRGREQPQEQPQTPGAPDYSAFLNSPDYQFALQQGNQQLDRALAATGQGGNRLRGGIEFGQGLASQQFGNYFNRLSGLAGIGQTATNQLGQAGQNYANQAGQNTLYAGNATASSYMNRANALGGFVNDAAYGYGRSQGPVYGLDSANAQWGAATGQNPYG